MLKYFIYFISIPILYKYQYVTKRYIHDIDLINNMPQPNSINILNQQKCKTYHVVISEINYQKLKSLGKMGDTFDSILTRILDRI